MCWGTRSQMDVLGAFMCTGVITLFLSPSPKLMCWGARSQMGVLGAYMGIGAIHPDLIL